MTGYILGSSGEKTKGLKAHKCSEMHMNEHQMDEAERCASPVQQVAVSHLSIPPCPDGRWGWRRREGVGGHCPGGKSSCALVRPGCPCDNGGDGYRENGWGER